MTRLRCTIPFVAGEALVGHASRLAACNGVGLVEFCRDMGIPLRGVVDGERGAVERLAELSGGEAGALATGAIGLVTRVVHLIRNQEVHESGLRRRILVACPRCLAEDVAGGGLPPVELARSRLIWNVRGIETCPVHRTALRTIEDDRKDDGAHDFSGRLAPYLGDLDRMADEAPELAPTAFEEYLSHRLQDGTGKDGLLDAMPFHAARTACLRLGILVTNGRNAIPRHLVPNQLREAEATGFEVMRDGEPGLHRALDVLQTRVPAGRGRMEGPGGVLGTFWRWLNWVGDGSAYDALSSSVVAHVSENYPLAAGTNLLGRTLERRRWHSVRSASLEVGLSPERVRRVLAEEGMIPKCAALVLFDAEHVAPLLATMGVTLRLPDVAVRLGVSREAVRRLWQDGHLGAGPQPRAKNSHCVQLNPGDVDRLVRRLLDNAEEIREGATGALGLAACAARLRLPRVDVLRLALDDRTLWRGRLAGREDASSLVLRPEEVEARLVPDSDGLPDVGALARRLKINLPSAFVLLREGILPSHVVPGPLYGRPARVVERSDLEAFASEYASLGMLAFETGHPVARLRQGMVIARVPPAFPVKRLRVALYRRSDLPNMAAVTDPALDRSRMSFGEVTRELRVNTTVAANIIEAGLLPSSGAPAPNGHRVVRYVLKADLDTFIGEYASLSTLARERSTNVASMYDRLRGAGVEPVLWTGRAHDPVYRRRDLPDAASAPGSELVLLSDAKRETGAGIGRGAVEALVAHGLVVAREVPGPATGTMMRVVATDDIKDFASLSAIARELGGDMDAVAWWLRSAGVEPVLKVNGRHGPVYRRADVPASRFDAGDPMMPLQAIVRRLGMGSEAISELIRCGAIPLRDTQRTSGRAPVRAVLQRDVDAFDAGFVGLAALARERGSTWHATRIWLELAGVEAVYPKEVCKALVYRRADVPAGKPEEAEDLPLNFRDVVRTLGMSHSFVSKLLDGGTIPSRLVPRPASRSQHRIVPASALRAFMDTYATAHMLAREIGASVSQVCHGLATHGIEPAFPPAEVKVHLYRRSEIAVHGGLTGPGPAAVTPRQMADESGMTLGTVQAILRAGLLPSRPMPGPVGGEPSRIVTRVEFDRFKAEYATAGMLAKELGRVAPGLSWHLSRSGVEPVLSDPGKCAAVYRRRDLPPLDGRWS